jgi:hypothetical protein
MHRLTSSSAVTRLRMAAFFLILTWILVPVALGLLALGLATGETDHVLLAGVLGSCGLVFGLAQIILAAKARCPLCMTPTLASKRCSKHREARTLLGSHRLRAAVWMITRGYFRCPFCNEPTAMEPRPRRSAPPAMAPRTRRR